jgi:DNA repair protein RecN (Recombination protein N)
MLREIFIQNLAIIGQARIELSPGLNVLTGETGTGKSLLVGAIELLLGERARGDIIRSGADQARVEAVLDLEQAPGAPEILTDAGYPVEEALVIRRTVSRSGKNRIYVNDRPATLGFLESLGQRLADIHGQHEHQSLLRVRKHRALLDLYGGLVPLQEEVTTLYGNLVHLQQDLSRLDEQHRQMLSERELASHQCEEIAQAGLRKDEEEELEQERKRLLHVERLREVCQEAERLLCDEERSVLDLLGQIQKRVQDGRQFDDAWGTPAELLEGAQHHLEEAAQYFQQYASALEGDPSRLEQIEERLAVLYRLKRKYDRSVEEILALGRELSEKIQRMDLFQEERDKLLLQITKEGSKLLQTAHTLSDGRKKHAKRLQAEIQRELGAIGMKETGFHVDVRSVAADMAGEDAQGIGLEEHRMNASGMDRVEFLIRPNPDQEYRPLQRIASGGELSRIMLAMRNVLRRADSLPTLVFDEVDAGVGGAEAEAVGSRLKKLSRHYQIVCITHLPQIAVFGDAHFKVSKRIEKRQTHFGIQRLDKEEREREIARMLGGIQITEKTLAHAREMLQPNARTESK